MGNLELFQNRAAISVGQAQIKKHSVVDVLFDEGKGVATGLCTIYEVSFELE